MLITKYNSLNYDLKRRKQKSITAIIIHYTGMQSERESLKRLISSKSRVSCHYLIGRSGSVLDWLMIKTLPGMRENQCGANYKNLNKNSIGIELVNKGHKFGYQSFTKIQINNLIKLCKIFKKKI